MQNDLLSFSGPNAGRLIANGAIAVFTALRLHHTFSGHEARLHTQLTANPTGFLSVEEPAIPLQDDPHPAIAVAYTGSAESRISCS